MSPNKLLVNWNGAALHLLAERAVFWPDENALLVADVHLGKEHVFGRAGVPIPAGPSQTTLQRLSNLLTQCGATECIVLGDFFHDTPAVGESWLQDVTHFLDQHASVTVHIVAGNHDRKAGQAMIDDRIVWHDKPLQRGPFVLQHEPGEDKRGHVLAGHIHPVVSLSKRYQRGVRGPCFWRGQHATVLPAFGEFTGGYKVVPEPEDEIYLTGPDCVIAVPTRVLLTGHRTGRRTNRRATS